MGKDACLLPQAMNNTLVSSSVKSFVVFMSFSFFVNFYIVAKNSINTKARNSRIVKVYNNERMST
jgi:hypothetical protein